MDGPKSGTTRTTVEKTFARYWRRNVIVMTVLLCLWAAAGLGAGVLFADTLNRYTLPGTGFPLGFWMAQQGSILVFVGLILAYCLVMNRFDARHLAELRDLEARRGS